MTVSLPTRHPGLEERIFLDYPLEMLLNRECSLKGHEIGLVQLLEAYDVALARLGNEERKQFKEVLGRYTANSAEANLVYAEAVMNWDAIKAEDWNGNWEKAFGERTAIAEEFGRRLKERIEAVAPQPVPKSLERLLGIDLLFGNRMIGSLQVPRGTVFAGKPAGSGSCNIVIAGPAGSAKSTLALQIAVAIASWPNNRCAIFFPLEESVTDVLGKARDLSPRWYEKLKPVNFLDAIHNESSPKAIGASLVHLIKHASAHPPLAEITYQSVAESDSLPFGAPIVLLPNLSPRPLKRSSPNSHPLFWERLQQLERLLTGAAWAREDHEFSQQIPPISAICIDGLSTLGERPLERDELWRLFDLFRQYGVIGICTVESGVEAAQMAASDVVDVLIRLESEKDNGYLIRYLEIVKARYHHQVYGRHPFKIRREADVGTRANPKLPFQAVRAYPSIHYVVFATESKPRSSAQEPPGQADQDIEFDFGIAKLRHALAPSLRRNGVLAMVGELNTGKTRLSRHFLMWGLHKKDNRNPKQESVLLVRLHEQTSFRPKLQPRWSLAPDLLDAEDKPLINWDDFREFGPGSGPWGRIEDAKMIRRCHQYAGGPLFFEVALKSGALLPEECIQFVRNVMRDQPLEYPVGRVVLDDVALIGSSYPFLRQSQNAGELFLSAFVHVMRNYGVDLLLLGTKTGLKEADEMVNRACTLADEVLTFEFCSVFGDRYVTIRGGGLESGAVHRAGSTPHKHYEMVPAVIVPEPEKNKFTVDLKKLEGLAGFGTNRIYRPGVILRTFQENRTVHRQYNEKLRELIQVALGVGPGGESGGASRMSPESGGVEILPFDADLNESFHDGLKSVAGKPIDRTIVATADEFFLATSEERKHVFAELPHDATEEWPPKNAYLPAICKRLTTSKLGVLPYYANVLLVAYREDEIENRTKWCETVDGIERVRSWREMKENRPSDLPFLFDHQALETGACLMLDVLAPRDPSDWSRFRENPIAVLESSLSTNPPIGELEALHSLVHERPMPKAQEKRPPNGGVYVYWYSQLRDLLRRQQRWSEKNPMDSIEYAPSGLRVCALPGWGFTGDWYIGVVDGSASIALGQELAGVLCSKKEEYQRLDQGVGLPTLLDFYAGDAFKAWPGSQVPLRVLSKIHGKACSRAEIGNYLEIKPVLYRAWRDLLAGQRASQIVEQLVARMKVLVSRQPLLLQ